MARMAAYGTWRVDILVSHCGACPLLAMVRKIRPIEYRPELQEDSAAVMTIMFMTSPIQARPIWPNTVTNGDAPALYWSEGSSMASSSHGTDVEHHDAEHDGADRLGDFALRVLHLAGGDADEFDARCRRRSRR